GADPTSSKRYAWVLGLSFADVPLLTDSLPVAKRALPGRSRSFALTWSDVSSCWDVGPLTA
ncbi:MAG TPA: hypothetical protein VNS62_14405, partial [Candidatus Udaeobacter sp.]|nr:hypothetical protein [Candidatus Udaeobacter sp.]